MKYDITTAVGIVLNSKSQVLLGRCLTDDDRNGKLCFPGGGVEEGEDIFSAAIREIKEETNIVPLIVNTAFIVHSSKPFVAYVVLTDTETNTPIFNDEYVRGGDSGWFDLDTLPYSDVFNLNLDILTMLNLIPKREITYVKDNIESDSDIEGIVESILYGRKKRDN